MTVGIAGSAHTVKRALDTATISNPIASTGYALTELSKTQSKLGKVKEKRAKSKKSYLY